jgi:hypothetical protein
VRGIALLGVSPNYGVCQGSLADALAMVGTLEELVVCYEAERASMRDSVSTRVIAHSSVRHKVALLVAA